MHREQNEANMNIDQSRIIANGLHDEDPRKAEYATESYYGTIPTRDALEIAIDVLRGGTRASTDITAALRTLQAVYSQRGLVDPDEGPVFSQDEYACECLDVWMFG
jgi:hypothetical protein